MCFFLNMVSWCVFVKKHNDSICVFFLNMVWWCVFVKKKHNDSLCAYFFKIWFGGVYLYLKKSITILYVRIFFKYGLVVCIC